MCLRCLAVLCSAVFSQVNVNFGFEKMTETDFGGLLYLSFSSRFHNSRWIFTKRMAWIFFKWLVVIFVSILNCWIFVNEIIRYFLDDASVLSDSVDGYVRLLSYCVVLDNQRRPLIKWSLQFKRNKADNLILMFCVNDRRRA